MLRSFSEEETWKLAKFTCKRSSESKKFSLRMLQTQTCVEFIHAQTAQSDISDILYLAFICSNDLKKLSF